ncbi:hypothetical protein CR513_10660, partial [Mucuna pruriens]
VIRLCSVCLHSAETKPDSLCRDRLCSVSVESNSAIAETTRKTTVKTHIIRSREDISCLRITDEKVDHEEDDHSDIADLDFEVELSELLDQVCNQEHSECTKNAAVKVAEIEEPPIAQLATIFTVEIKSSIKSSREGRFEGALKVNSAKKSNTQVDTFTEIVSANEDQTRAEVEITVPSGSGSKTAQEANADSDPTRIKTTESSWPKQPKAEIMSAHLVPSRDQVDQSDPNPATERSPLPPTPMELKQLPSHLKYAYLDKEQQLPVIIANNLH